MLRSTVMYKEVCDLANIIIKSQERKDHEEFVRNSYGVNPSDKASCEAAEIVAARSREAIDQLNKMGGKK